MDKKSAKKIAMQIAEDLEGPLGRIPMERVLEKHIVLFNELRSEGASWPQIAVLLSSAGVTRKDGKPMSASQLRATVSRISSPSIRAPSPPHQPSPRTLHKANHLENSTQGKQPIREMMKRATQARKP